MEHVEVMQDIRDAFIEMGGDAADVAALNAAITALKALEYVFGLYTDWGRVVEEKLTPPWPLEHHAKAMGLIKDNPPAEAQSVAWLVRWQHGTHRRAATTFTEHGDAEDYYHWRNGGENNHPVELLPLYTAPPTAPVGVEGLVERMHQAPDRLWMADLVGQKISVERMRDILTFAIAQQPAADPLVEWANSPLNFTATVGVYKDGPQLVAVDEDLRKELVKAAKCARKTERSIERAKTLLAGQQQGGAS